MEPYIKAGATTNDRTVGRSVWLCPDYYGSYPDGVGPSSVAGTPNDQLDRPMASYACNISLMATASPFSPSVSKIDTPSNLIMIVENRYATPVSNVDDSACATAGSNSKGYCTGRARHNGGGSYVLADGHVKFMLAPTNWQQPSATFASIYLCSAGNTPLIRGKPISGCQ